MKVTHNGKRLTLKGVKPDTTRCTPISARKLKGLARRGAISCCLQVKLQYAKEDNTQAATAICLVTKSTEELHEIQQVLS